MPEKRLQRTRELYVDSETKQPEPQKPPARIYLTVSRLNPWRCYNNDSIQH